MKITYNDQTKTAEVQFDAIDVAIYEEAFEGGPSEGLESLLTQNRRQRRDQIFNHAIANVGDGPVSYIDKDDMVSQYFAKPEYMNAKKRRVTADIEQVNAQLAELNAQPASKKRDDAITAAEARIAELQVELA